jgi:GTP-binding protein
MPPTLHLEATAYTRSQLVFPEEPQVALAGRSNVGKSSLINALAGRKQLAKVSSEPGKTRSVNYYRLDASPAFLVDLPGYGYARCSKEERHKWAGLLEHYLTQTPGLTALLLLLDGRLPPQSSDRSMAEFALAHGMPLIGVLTKVDKGKQREREVSRSAWEALLGDVPLIPVSSHKKTGLETLWEHILTAVSPEQADADEVDDAEASTVRPDAATTPENV